VKLYADALNDVELSHFAQLMLTMEIQAVKHYWHVSNYDIYDAALGSSRMIGMLSLQSDLNSGLGLILLL
jgi:endoglucanase Acf2